VGYIYTIEVSTVGKQPTYLKVMTFFQKNITAC